MDQGVDEDFIIITKERISRAKTLNKYISVINTRFIGLCDDDVVISDNAVAQLEKTLDENALFGMVLAPTFQTQELTKPTPKLKSNTHSKEAQSVVRITRPQRKHGAPIQLPAKRICVTVHTG